MRSRSIYLALIGLLLLSCIASKQKLPKVLIIGDSIAGDYFEYVQEELKGKAEIVKAIVINEKGDTTSCEGSTMGVKFVDQWIGNTDWDIIHFNFGLHDIKHIDPTTGKNSKNLSHPQQANPKEYGRNLEIIVSKLKATNAKLVFATTTPYPDKLGRQMRSPGMPHVYNDVALKIMSENDVMVNDLYSFVLPRMKELQRPKNVHFLKIGSRELGMQVARRISSVLNEEYGTIDGLVEQDSVVKGKLLYLNSFSNQEDIEGWKMEGPGVTIFKGGWMHMYSPEEAGHHVLWCPEDFPESFIVEWEFQNQEPDAGLCIIFFAAKGLEEEDVLDPSLKRRNGKFSGYTKSDISNYHISYYANTKDNRAREVAHLRKNPGFNKVQIGTPGIPIESTEIHKARLVKNKNHIIMSIDGREIINWKDDGIEYGGVLQDGKIALRQMKWSHFGYRNFKVWEVKNN